MTSTPNFTGYDFRYWLIAFLSTALLLIAALSLMSFANAHTGKQVSHQRLLGASPNASVKLVPSGRCTMVSMVYNLTPNECQRFFACLTNAPKVSPSHPTVTRDCHVEVTDESGVSFGTIALTEDNGTLLFSHSRKTDGWHLGAFRCDELGSYVGALAAAQEVSMRTESGAAKDDFED